MALSPLSLGWGEGVASRSHAGGEGARQAEYSPKPTCKTAYSAHPRPPGHHSPRTRA